VGAEGAANNNNNPTRGGGPRYLLALTRHDADRRVCYAREVASAIARKLIDAGGGR
jgi:hypothetical protein